MANGELLLLTGNGQLACWKVDEPNFRVSAPDRQCCSPPLIVGTEVYIANGYSKKVEKWSLEANRFV